jgi:hypothetical protein
MRKIREIIKEYRTARMQYPDPWIEDCRLIPLKEAIALAATARDFRNKKHPHQHRRTEDELNSFCSRILAVKRKIKQAKSFHELYEIIESCAVKGVAALTIYDTAHRIGKNKEILLDPDEVYIHRGTRDGAEIFFGRNVREKSLSKDMFKGMEHLAPEEIEDVLCIYKDHLFKSKCVRIDEVKQVCAR